MPQVLRAGEVSETLGYLLRHLCTSHLLVQWFGFRDSLLFLVGGLKAPFHV